MRQQNRVLTLAKLIGWKDIAAQVFFVYTEGNLVDSQRWFELA